MMQRYEIGSVSAVTGMAHLEEDDIGDYVLYSDAHALEVRVAELEKHVLTLCECIETDPDCKDDYTYQVRDARKALAQTEGGEEPKSP